MFRKVWAGVDLHMPLAEVPAFARRVEALGFDGISVADAVHDGPLTAAAVIGATSRVAVRSSGFVAFARSPYTTAVAAWDLQALSNGRFELGLGPLVRSIIVDRYSMPWEHPAARLREYILAVQAIFDCWQHGTPLRFIGDHYRLTRMQDYMKPPRQESDEFARMPIVVAGIGPMMTAVAGELADAINTHPTNSNPRFLREVTMPNLAKGAARSGRDPQQIGVIVSAMCATGRTEEEVLRRREPIRQLLGTLLSTPQYRYTLELYGWGELGQRLNQMVREGRWSELGAQVTDEILDVYVPAATYEDLPHLLADRYEGLATEIGLPLGDDPSSDAEIARVIEELKS
jgi:probable F420-dependent oxidoreductase